MRDGDYQNGLIQVRNRVPYIRDTNITVGEILEDCWDHSGGGSTYQYREIIDTIGRKGVTITDEDLGAARQFAIRVLTYGDGAEF